jgi:hypothetical protein
MTDVDMNVLYFFGVILACCISVLIGKYMDKHWRLKYIERGFLKKNAILLNICSTDGKTIKQKIVNPDGDVVAFENYIWVFGKWMLWRKEIMGDKIVEQKEKGFKITEKDIKYDEGVPTLFVDYESLQPLEMKYRGQSREESAVKAPEIGAWLLAYELNKMTKALAEIKIHHMITLIVLALVFGSLAIGAANYMATDTTNKKLDTITSIVNATAQTQQQAYVQPAYPTGANK